MLGETQIQFSLYRAPSRKQSVSLLSLMAAGLLAASSVGGATFTVINTNAAGDGSLYQAILDANASVGADLIAFNIPSGGLTIRPTNALPVITEPVTLDGSTQPGYSGAPLIDRFVKPHVYGTGRSK